MLELLKTCVLVCGTIMLFIILEYLLEFILRLIRAVKNFIIINRKLSEISKRNKAANK